MLQAIFLLLTNPGLNGRYKQKHFVVNRFFLHRFRWWIVVLAVMATAFGSRAEAQVVPDSTLGIESSQVEIDGTTDLIIRGGAQRQENLFHSFERFGIDEGQRVTFENPTAVQRVFGRVTGNVSSDVQGTLGSTGTADVFLLNPNGIVFGPNARLDVGGSFVASTAESIKFADDTTFSTAEPSTALLSINVPLGLQYGSNVGDVKVGGSTLQVNSNNSLMLLGGNVTLDGGQLIAEGGQIEIGGVTAAGTLAFFTDSAGTLSIGFWDEMLRGDVLLSNGTQVNVTSPNGGDISVNARNLNISERGVLSAGISQMATAAGAIAGDITINATEAITLEGSSVIQNIVNADAVGEAGRVELQAGSLNLLTGSQLFTSTFGRGNAGQVSVEVQDAVVIDSAGDNTSTSGIISSVAESAIGSGGDIDIAARSLSIINGAQLNAITFGQGDAGSVVIEARETASFEGANVGASGILNAVAPSGRGSGGDIEIVTGIFSVTSGAQLSTITRGNGNAGNVTIEARETVSIDGENPSSIENPFAGASSVFTSVSVDDVGTQAVGDGGDISIQTGSLSLTNGGQLNAITKGQGNAGNVRINARDRVFIDGERQLSSTRAPSAIVTSVDSNEFSGFAALAPAVGNGGNIDIATESLVITNGAFLSGLTGGDGDAGNVTINAQEQVLLDGENSKGGASGIFSAVADNLFTGQPPARGEGGDVDITTSALFIRQGAGIFANTRGLGNAGSVRVTASDHIAIDGENASGGASGIFSSVGDETDFPPAVGDGSNVDVTTEVLSITNGGGIFTNTAARGNAGDINLNAREVLLEGGKLNGSPSGLYGSVSSNGVGDGGDITVISERLRAEGGAGIFANAVGQGNAGNVDIATSDRISLNGSSIRTTSESDGQGGNIGVAARVLSLVNQSEILTQTLSTDGGNITLTLEDLLALTDNSTISTEAGTAQTGGNGGDIAVRTRFIVATPNENNDIVADAFDGNGGNVDITATDGIFGIAARGFRTSQSDITASSQNGVSGDIDIQSPEIDPNQGAVELPVALVGPEVVRSCRETFIQSGSEFIISGRGGLSQGPLDPTVAALWQDILPVENGAQNNVGQNTVDQNTEEQIAPEQNTIETVDNDRVEHTTAMPIVEAQGFAKDENGETFLAAIAPQPLTAGRLTSCQG